MNKLPHNNYNLYQNFINDNYNRSSLGSAYTASGGMSASIVSNQLNLSSTASSFSSLLTNTGYGYSMLQNWTQTLTVQVTSVTTQLNFIGLQFGNITCGIFSYTNTLDGTLRIYSGTSLMATGASSQWTTHVNDVLVITVFYNLNSIVLNITNVTQGITATPISWSQVTSSTSNSIISSTVPAGAVNNNIYGQFAICVYYGNYIVTNWNVSCNQYVYKNCDTMFLGHSIVKGFSSINWGNSNGRFSDIYAITRFKQVCVEALQNALTQDIINVMPEILAVAPKRVIIQIGCNDIYFGVATATWKANLTTINNDLVNAGINVVWLYAIPFNGIDITPINTYIAANFPVYIDVYTPMATGSSPNPSYYAADLIHPNNAGEVIMANQILLSN